MNRYYIGEYFTIKNKKLVRGFRLQKIKSYTTVYQILEQKKEDGK